MTARKLSAARKLPPKLPPRLPPKLPLELDDVAAAQARLRGAIVETDCGLSCTLSSIVGCRVWLKFENLQFTASFKERGALNRLSALTPAERRRGVIAMSAGNHAQGVAYHAHRLAIPSTIVMPVNTPMVKVANTRGHGAEVIQTGETVEEAAQFARQHGAQKGLTFIHPYDDPLVIAGQGTIALEMLGAAPEIDTLLVPIGGGGLISGIAIAAKAVRPGMRVIGVQTALYPSMYNATRGEHLAIEGDTLAEGIAVRDPGKLTTQIVEQLVDDIVLVSEAEIEHAVSLLLSIEKTVVEGAGAVGLAAALQQPEAYAGRAVGLVLSGGNIDTRLLASVLTRELAREGRLAQLCIDLRDRPGALANVANVLAAVGANIVEVTHQRVFSDLPARRAMLDVVIETRDRRHLQEAVACLRNAGFSVDIRKGAGER
jgi:threonine dehydratase